MIRNRPPEREMLPSFRPHAGDPHLPDGTIGIRIATTGLDTSVAQPYWPLSGTFRIPMAALDGEPELALRRIVLVLSFASSHDIQARRAFRDELVFPEDVQVASEFVSGTFRLDLLRLFTFISPQDSYFIVASIGDHVSDVVACEAMMPWLTPAPEEPSPEDEEDPQDDDGADEEDEDDGDTSWMVDDPF